MKRLVLAVALVIAAFPPAFARDPTPEERTRIEAILRGEGFQRWDEIEFEHGMWQVDDAIGTDGCEYGLKLDPNTFVIVERNLDEDRKSTRLNSSHANISYAVFC